MTINHKIEAAISKCVDIIIDNEIGKFLEIYPFTTENITNYLNLFTLKDKNLLTVGSSTDQAINASLAGCQDITIIDICPFTKEYFYLKKAALLTFNRQEFLKYFFLKDYLDFIIINRDSFSKDQFQSLAPVLKSLDQESYHFWQQLYSECSPLEIRTGLFTRDEDSLNVLTEINPYLNSDTNYALTKQKILNTQVKFIEADLQDSDIHETYDNIFLSNIYHYLDDESFYQIITKMITNNLKPTGQLLLTYIYNTIDTDKVQNLMTAMATESNCPKTFFTSEQFTGVCTYSKKVPDNDDAVIIYQKK